MIFKKTLCALVAAVTFGIAGGSQPTIEKKEDLTGDGIEDVIVNVNYGPQNGNWLFIGQKDGTYVRAGKHKSTDGIEYYRTDDGQAYFHDGEIYRLSPQKE